MVKGVKGDKYALKPNRMYEIGKKQAAFCTY
jgi:hypothetical protein